ncbi:MAG: ATP-binding protein [Muribaculaceae bacterium]|nr:ATP-binding protein [Muribaculaceae bacterium]
MKFFDRTKEIKLLKEIRVSSLENAQFTVLTGRRRIGKTSLVLKAYEDDNVDNDITMPMVYLFVSRKAEKDLCAGFSAEIERVLDKPILGEASRFADIFEFLMKTAGDTPITVFIDEFQDFMMVNPSIFSDMQKIWDLYKNEARINLVVSGSINSLMNKLFRDSKQPLYQRETGMIKLQPFETSVLKEILDYYHKDYQNEDLLALYSFTGGVAKYVELLIDNKGFTKDRMIELMIREGSTFIDEGKVMLIGEFGKEYGTYFSILSAIASGHCTRAEIESIVGKEISGYLSRLENDYEIIARRQPLYEKTSNKNVNYTLRDNFMTFWFRFIYKYGFMLEVGAYGKMRELIIRDYNTFSGFMLERYFRAKLIETGEYTRVGGWWDRKGTNEIDIIAADDLEEIIRFYEVKRNSERYDQQLLIEKSDTFFMVNKNLAHFKKSFACLSLKDM